MFVSLWLILHVIRYDLFGVIPLECCYFLKIYNLLKLQIPNIRNIPSYKLWELQDMRLNVVEISQWMKFRLIWTWSNERGFNCNVKTYRSNKIQKISKVSKEPLNYDTFANLIESKMLQINHSIADEVLEEIVKIVFERIKKSKEFCKQ